MKLIAGARLIPCEKTETKIADFFCVAISCGGVESTKIKLYNLSHTLTPKNTQQPKNVCVKIKNENMLKRSSFFLFSGQRPKTRLLFWSLMELKQRKKKTRRKEGNFLCIEQKITILWCDLFLSETHSIRERLIAHNKKHTTSRVHPTHAHRGGGC
eukprot:GEMP01107952.1.p1 GENE.GEMP01107952.1~~GEMP01107952.1.p1  ORF type:complete len:156 (-),score=2.32 GEMP01107952.1:71-538(-)